MRSFRGNYVLVDFWASWCVPCRAENPNVVQNFQRYKDKNFTVLGVSLDGPNAKEAWLKAIHQDGLAWTHVSDLKSWDNEVAKRYPVRLVPQNFLVGPDGKIVAKNIRGEALGVKLADILTRKPYPVLTNRSWKEDGFLTLFLVVIPFEPSMYNFIQTVFFLGLIIMGYVLSAYFYRKAGLLVIFSPGPYMIGYGLMKVARYKK